MERINTLLNKQVQIIKNSRPRNLDWEEAAQFASYINLRPAFVYKMFKIYGKNKVLALASYLKDLEGTTNLYGLIQWKLKNDCIPVIS